MSLRKLLSLLLLTAFAMTSITPANAAVTFNSNVTLPTIAQDEGTRSDGANRDVVPLVLRIGFTGGDITFAPDGGAADAAALQNGDSFSIGADGELTSGGATGFTLSPTNGNVAIFVPPTGTEFVKLTANAYKTNGTTLEGNVTSGASTINGVTLINVTADSATTASFPGTGAGAVVAATVITSGASETSFGTGASTEFPAGSLIVHFFTKTDAPNHITTGAGGTIIINGIGLAADPGSSLGTSGNLQITYKTPNVSATTSPAISTSAVADDTAITVATKADNIGKLEFLQVGTVTGTEVSTTAEPDNQPNTILASQISGSTVNVAPGFVTSTGTSLSSANLDTDALLIRAAERADSTSSSRTYYQTPFNTSALVLTQVFNGREATTIRDLTLANNTTNFPNASNALITVTFALETPAGGASTATLAVNAVTVSLVGPRAFNGFRNTGTTVGGQTQSIETGLLGVRGFLGGMINQLDNAPGTSGVTKRTLYGAATLYNGAASVSQYQAKDTFTADYAIQDLQRGITSATINTLIPNADTIATVSPVAPSSDRISIFPGSMIINGTSGATGTWDLVNTANGSGSTPFTFTAAASAQVHNTATFGLANPAELSIRFINGTAGASIGNTGYFIIQGSNGADASAAIAEFRVASTNVNRSTETYDNGVTLKSAANTVDVANNVMMVGKLKANVLEIMPIIEKFDGLRDVIAIRPEATITLDTTSKTTGVNLVATATGNNLPSSGVKLTIAKILPTGGFSAGLDLTASALPTHGTVGTPALMREKTTDAGLNRAAVTLSSVTGATTSTDSLADIIGTENSLDTTLPPLFCGGTAGTSTRGPNGVVFQPKGRAILLTENGTTNFQAIEDLGSNTVIRVTLPAGWDLNKYTATNGNLLAIGVSGGLSATIVRVQPITSAVSQAFIDLSVDSSSTTVATKRLLGLFFKPNALVVPSNVTGFAATVAIYNNAGTSSTTDDTLVGNVGTVNLGTACSQFLTVSFCDSSISSFVASGTTTQTTENGRVATSGSQLTEFGAGPSSVKRLVKSSAPDVALPDLCITEGIADALPVGSINDGVPSQFGESASTTVGDVVLHIASSFTAADNVGIDTAPTAVLFSDTSIIADGATGTVAGDVTNEITIPLQEGTASSRKRPFEVKTEIRLSGISLDASGTTTPVTAQDFIAWVEVPVTGGSYAVGSNAVISNENVNTTTNEFFAGNLINSGTDEDDKYSNFFSDKTVDDTAGTAIDTDFGDTDTTAATNNLQVALGLGNHSRLSNAVVSLLDNTGYDLLNEDTIFSVQVSDISGSTDKKVLVSTGAGELEPGSLVTVNNSGSGNSDSVTVPVLDDGSFIAAIRASTSQSIVVTQSPTSGQAGALQVRELSVEDQNVDPEITAAVAEDIGIGAITKKGKAPVVFTVSAKGKLNGVDFVPTAAQLKVGANSVTAVDSSTTQFIGVVDFSKSTGTTVTATANGDTSSTVLSGLTTANPTLTGAPILKSVKVNKKGKLVLNGTRLRTGGTFGFILSDGTFSPVDLSPQNSNQKKSGKRTSADTASIPDDAVLAVFHVPGRGISTISL